MIQYRYTQFIRLRVPSPFMAWKMSLFVSPHHSYQLHVWEIVAKRILKKPQNQQIPRKERKREGEISERLLTNCFLCPVDFLSMIIQSQA